MNGKGDKRRKMFVTIEEWNKNWNDIFRKNKNEEHKSVSKVKK
jgi:hypothetical protein